MTDNIPEAELNSPPPRRVRSRDGFRGGCSRWFLRLFILPHTIAGLAILMAALGSTGQYLYIWAFGTNYDGQLVRKTETKGNKGGTTYSAHYAYSVDGQEYTGRVPVDVSSYQSMSEGDSITVRALESSPNWGHWPGVPGHSTISGVGAKWVTALFWNGIVSVFFYMAYIAPLRSWWLVRSGCPTSGIIRDVQDLHGKGPKSWRITYEYLVPARDGSAEQVFRRKMTTSRKELGMAISSDVVTVLYHPSKPWRSLVYKYSEYRAE